MPGLATGAHDAADVGTPSGVVCKIGQMANWLRSTLFAMGHEIQILKVENDSGDGVIVTFSDGTISAYVVEELLDLRPSREHVEEPAESLNLPIA